MKPPASDLTLEELALLKGNAAEAISGILNRFSEQTGLTIESVDLHVAVTLGNSPRYAVELDVRL